MKLLIPFTLSLLLANALPQLGMPVSYTSGGTATPVLFQHISTSTNPAGLGISGRAFVIHTEALPPNSVAVIGVTAVHGKTISISDTLAGSWSAAVCSADAGTGEFISSVFVEPLGATGGADTITVGVGASNTQPVQFDLTIWENINTTSPVGGHVCTAGIQTNASDVVIPGSFTPTNNNANGGNVIWNYTPLCANAGFNASGWTAASGFTLLNSEIIWANNQGFPQAAQYELQTAATSVTASITATGEGPTDDCFNSDTVALAVANNSATAPSTIHVVGIFHESVTAWNSPGTMKVQIPFKGDLRVITFTWPGMSPNGGAGNITSITSSDSCNFTSEGVTGGNYIWYAQGCSACPTCTVNLVWTGTESEPQLSFRIYDVENAITSSYQNSVSTAAFACSTTVTDAPTFTPTGASSGLVISTLGNGNGPVTGFASGAPSGATFDLWNFTGQTDTDVADNADESSHYYFSSTAAQNWNYTKTNGSDECYNSAATFD